MITSAEVNLMRRWLWEQFNISAHFRTEAPGFAIREWNTDPVACARSLVATLNRMLQEGECVARDAITWARSASVEGRKVSRVVIASDLGLQPRDLHRHLATVDEAIARHASKFGFERTKHITTREKVISGLVQAAAARIQGSIDEADGFYLAAADLADLPTTVRILPVGRDRTTRTRVRHRARRTLPLSPKVSPEGAAHDILVMRSSLESDPAEALRQLEHAWRIGDFAALPLLLQHALSAAPDPVSVGPNLRAWLLEVGANIFRDAESLMALTWTSAWIREATADAPGARRIAANGRKTRAHVLQLHGFLDAAGDELKLATEAFAEVDHRIEDYQIIKADLQVRSVALAALSGDVVLAHDLLEKIEDNVSDQMKLGAQRYRLQIESMAVARTLQRRSFSRVRAAKYEHALSRLSAALPSVPADRRLTVVDTVIAAAVRVGDVASIRTFVDQIDWVEASAQPNIKFRLAGRLKQAAKLPLLGDLGDIRLGSEYHPLRSAGMVPRDLRYLM
ncbi:hypothetical protein AXK60_09175 [Tsukamurella pseudospumae]|uniref:Uncharacterized protein n=1 Tax=Tsukamurella pseudospumae TaxID=239498 RepID=A0A138AED2_9ACTN|nr:hypothetical protein AXK60_09175 [Tsukamurella pseudospumae]